MQLNPAISASVASLLLDQGEGILSSNLVYDDAVDTAEINQVLFIDSNVKDFQTYANARTFSIIYDRMCTREQMMEVLSKKFTSISRIAFVNHFSETPYFLNQESLFSEANKQFVVDIITQFHVSNVDYLACSTLSSTNWTTYYSELQAASTSVIIGASDNDTGNIKYGGDWIMESTQEDVRAVYFNDQIQNYASLLVTINITTDTSTLTYTYTSGVFTASVTAWISGTSVTIPSSVAIDGNTYNVTSIGASAFQSCISLTSINIQTGITSIGASAFQGCTYLTSITIPNSVATIGNSAVQSCTRMTSVTLPTNILFKSINYCAFYQCPALTSITIPNSVTIIGGYAFQNCYALPSIEIPSSVTSISDGVFYNCTSMTSLILPTSGLNSIGPGAIQNCSKLASITIPSSVTDIGSNAFQGCSLLTSVTLPTSGLKNIGINAFYSCVKLNSITIPSSVTNIDNTAFQYCSLLSSVTLPTSGLTRIGDAAFASTGITSIILPSSVTNLVESVFSGCTQLSNVKFASPCNITLIKARLFQGCVNLLQLSIPGSVTTINDTALSGCTNLTKVYFFGTDIPTILGNSFTASTSDTAYYIAGTTNTSRLSVFTTQTSFPDLATITAAAEPAAAPAAPTITSITAGNTTATINFTAGSSNGSAITNYKYSTDNGSSWTTLSPASTSSPIVVSGLTNGQTYQVKLQAVNAIGVGTASSSTSVTPATPATAPAAPTITSITAGDQSATINFTAGSSNGSAITNYKYSTDNGSSWVILSPSSTSSPIVVSGLTNGQTYQVKLIAINNVGEGAASSSTSVTPAAAPAAPTITSITAGDQSATINFTAGSSNGSAITNYKYSTDNGSSWTTRSPSSTSSPIVVSGLTNGQLYQVKLKAVNAQGEGTASVAQSVTPVAAPAAPTITSVTAGDQSASIAFTAGSDNGSAITNYKYSTDNGSSWTALSPSSTSSPIVVSGLTNGQTYQVKLIAINNVGEGAASSSTSVTPAAAPAAPTITSITAGNQSASIAFTAGSDNGSAITNYKYSTDNGSSWITRSPFSTSSPIVVSGLTNDQTYQVKLMAINNVGEGAASSSTSVTPAAEAPSAPTITEVLAGDQSATINFTAGSDNGSAITNYKYSTDDGSSWTALSPSSTSSPIVVSGLTNGQVYQVKLIAINNVGEGVASSSASVTPAAVPAAPTITSITAGDQSATINFTAGSDNGAAITNYKYSTDDGSSWAALSPSSTSSPIVVSGLTNGQLYQVKLKAVNAQGEGVASSAQSVTPAAAPAAPTIIEIVAGDQSAKINFTEGSDNGSEITSYQYSMNNGSSWITLASSEVDTLLNASNVEYRAINVSGLTNGQVYQVKLKVVNAMGTSNETEVQSVTPAAAPAVPTIIEIVASHQSATINFTDGANNGSAITSYQYSINNGSSWVTLDTLEVDTLLNASSVAYRAIYVSSLTNGQTYQVKLKAVNAMGASNETEAQSVTPATKPDKPTIIEIVAGDQTATINFTDGTNNGPPLTSYQYSTNNGSSWTTIDPLDVDTLLNASSVEYRSINVSGLTNGEVYQVKLKAVNAMGVSDETDAQSVTPAAAPAVPTIINIVAGDQSATINFTDGANNGSAITSYQYSMNNGSTWITLGPLEVNTLLNASSVEYRAIYVSGLTNGETYQVKLKVVNAMGTSDETSVQSVTPAAAPAVPTIIDIVAGNQSATINFTDGANNGSAITSYQYSTNNGSSWTTLATLDVDTLFNASSVEYRAINVSGLTNGQVYQVKLKALNAMGTSDETEVQSVTPAAAPAAPTIIDIVAGDQSTTINFTDGANNGSAITSYQYSMNNGSTWITLGQLEVNTLLNASSVEYRSIYVSGLTNGETYQVKLKVVNAMGTSDETSGQSVTPAAAPAVPTIIEIVAGNQSATINFTEGANNGAAITSYQYSMNNGSSWTTLASSEVDTLLNALSVEYKAINVSGLTNGEVYQVKLKAVNVMGTSDETEVQSVTPATAPAVPTIINIVAGDKSARINFTDGANNGSAITSYQYSINNGGDWTTLDPLEVDTLLNASSVEYRSIYVSGLTNGETYQVKLKVVNAMGTSDETSVQSVKAAAKPDKPTIIEIVAGNQSATINFTDGSNNGSAIISYRYYCSMAGQDIWTTLDASVVANNTIYVSGLTNGETYYIKLTATNAMGTSDETAALSVIPATKPDSPTITSVIDNNQSLSIVYISNSDNGRAITSYQYSVNDGADWVIIDVSLAASPIVVTDLTNGQTYQVKLRATNEMGTSDEITAQLATPATTAEAPIITDITASNKAISIAFEAGLDNGAAITNYYYSTNDGINWTARSPASTISPILITELKNGKPYSIKLKALNRKGFGDESAAQTATPAGVPMSPYIYNIIAGNELATINFTAGFDNGSAITNYQYICTPTGTPIGTNWIPLDPASVDTSIVVTGLTNGQTYQVKIKAVNAIGDSIESNTKSVKPFSTASSPTITITNVGDSTATININPHETNGSIITNYKYSLDNGDHWTDRSPASTASSLVLSELENGKSYLIAVKAITTTGDSTSSIAQSVTPAGLPYPPTIDDIISGDQSVTIYFSAHFDNGSVITTYKHSYSSNGGSTWSNWSSRSEGTNESPLVISGLTNGQSYIVKIKAVSAKGESSPSNTSSPEIPAAAPDAPTLTSVITGDSTITINFSDNADNGTAITNYMYSIDNGDNWTECIPPMPTNSIEVLELENGASYSVRLIAMNDAGNSVASNVISVILAGSPDAPTITDVTGGYQYANIAFTASSDNDSPISTYKYSYLFNDESIWSDWIERSTGTTASPIRVDGLTNGVPYVFRIRAVNAVDDGAVSIRSLSFTPGATPSNPIISPTSTAGNKTINIVFTPPSADNGFEITNYGYSTNNGVDWTDCSPLTITSPIVITTILENGILKALANGTTYSVIIAAKNILGYGAPSNSINFMPKSAPGPARITSIIPANAIATINFTGAFNNGDAITNYKYSIDNGKTWTTCDPVVKVSPIVVTKGLKNDIPYLVKIMALNTIGLGEYSDSSSVTLTPGVPFAPIISSTGGNNSATINVTAGDANGSPITNYTYSVNNGSWTPLSPAQPSAKTISISGLTNGETYTITLKAINIKGDGTASLPTSVVPAGPPFAPRITSIDKGNASAIINFDPSYNNGSTITNYKYSVNGKWVTTPAPIDNKIRVSGLTNATLYSMTIIAISEKWAAGGAVSNTMSVTPAGAPAKPIITKITAGDRKVNLTFTAGANNGSEILSYQYSYTLDSEVNWSTWTTSNWTTSDASINIVNLTNGTPYSVKLRAINAEGGGVESFASLVATPYGSPFAPKITTIEGGDKKATIYFDASGNNGSPINKYSYSLNNGIWTEIKTYKVGDASLNITGLINGQTYSVRIKAISVAYIAGSEGSAPMSVTPAALPVAPNITKIEGGNRTATITFTAGANNGSAITNYMYSLDGSTNWVTLVPSSIISPIVVSDLSNGTTYPINLKAITSVGVSLASKSISVTPAGPPSAPTNLAIIRGNASANITFTPGASNGSAITAYYYSLNNQAWVKSKAVPTATSMLIPGLVNGTTYSITIKAISAKFIGGGASSDPISVTPAALPALPIITGVTGGNNNATINFTAGAANGNAITNYKYSMNNGVNWTILDPSSTISPIVVSDLSNGQIYQVKLKAINDVGESIASVVKSVTPSTAPAAPYDLAITRGNGSATITFTRGADNGSTITGYLYSLNNQAWTKSKALPTATSMLISGLTNGTLYFIKIKAVTAKYPSEGLSSSRVSVTPAAVPAAPVITSPIVASNQTATINFTSGAANGSAITNYKYSLDISGSNWTFLDPSSTTSPIVIPNLTNGQSYYVRLIAINDVGASLASVMVPVTPADVPSGPSIIGATALAGVITINFTPPANNNGSTITNYAYAYSTNNGLSWTTTIPSRKSVTSPIITSKLVPGTSYSVKIMAINAIGTSADSNIVEVTA